MGSSEHTTGEMRLELYCMSSVRGVNKCFDIVMLLLNTVSYDFNSFRIFCAFGFLFTVEALKENKAFRTSSV